MAMTIPEGRTINLIAAVTVGAFLLALASGREEVVAYAAGFIPERVNGALPADLGIPFAVPAILTPLTATLVHAGWLHLGFNMLMLLFCGRHVEQVFGRWPLLVLYGIGAYAAAAAQWAVDPGGIVPMVGASGAISALMGTYALLYSRQNVRAIGPLSANAVRILWLAAGWIGLQALIGVAMGMDAGGLGQIAVAAHVGGFVAGLLLTRPLLRWRFRALQSR